MPYRLLALVLSLGLLLPGAGCRSETPIALAPPEGWQQDQMRWWKAGLDTAGVFRDLETLAAMGVPGDASVYLSSPQEARRRAGGPARFEHRVRHSLLPLFRNQPAVVDSLFEQYVAPVLQGVTLAGDLDALVEDYQHKGYKLLHSHFREPVMVSRLGKDVPVTYPDSLRAHQGRVRVQAYLDEEGMPVAVVLLEGVHPVLDRIALRASTQVRWRPAYLLRKGRWVPLQAWARFSVRFAAS